MKFQVANKPALDSSVVLLILMIVATKSIAANKLSSKLLKKHQVDRFDAIESNSIDNIQTNSQSAEHHQAVGKHSDENLRLYNQLQHQLLEQAMRQRVAEKDHLMMEKWLVDNINDLHRELKQTESDFEHYVQVTKEILAQNDIRLKQQVAATVSLSSSKIATLIQRPINLDKHMMLRAVLIDEGRNWT